MISIGFSDKDSLAERKYHLTRYGDLMFCNGYGIRFDCHECHDGVAYETGEICRICGPKLKTKKRR